MSCAPAIKLNHLLSRKALPCSLPALPAANDMSIPVSDRMAQTVAVVITLAPESTLKAPVPPPQLLSTSSNQIALHTIRRHPVSPSYLPVLHPTCTRKSQTDACNPFLMSFISLPQQLNLVQVCLTSKDSTPSTS